MVYISKKINPLLVSLLLVAYSCTNQAIKNPNTIKTNSEQSTPYDKLKSFDDLNEQNHQLLIDWINKRVTDKQLIKLPIAIRSAAWGCNCPDYYVGFNTNVNEGYPWLTLQVSDSLFPKMSTKGTSIIATGYFTGTKDTITYSPEEESYPTLEFKVLSWQNNNLSFDTPLPKIISK